MREQEIAHGDVTAGMYVTVWHYGGEAPTDDPANFGQGGTVTATSLTDDDPAARAVTIMNPLGAEFTYTVDQIDRIVQEVAHEPDECLEYGPDCNGPVDYHWTGGTQSWPRCDHHQQRRMERREESLERYADSDGAPPAWFDPADAGETW